MDLNHNFPPIVKISSEYVRDYFNQNLPQWAFYHNCQHTLETVEACIEIGSASALGDDDLEIIIVAAWFHDTGYFTKSEGHEDISCEIAEKFLKMNNYSVHKIHSVFKCISATKTSVAPVTQLDNIIKDADLISLGRSDYFEKNDLLRAEIELRDGITYSEIDWLKRSLNFLASHKFFTEYAKSKYSPHIADNLKILNDQIKRVESC